MMFRKLFYSAIALLLFAGDVTARSPLLPAPQNNNGLASGPWIWRQNFQAGTYLGPSQVFTYGGAPSTIAAYPYNSTSGPLGAIPRPPDGGAYYAISAGTDASGYGLKFGSNYNNNANGDFVKYPQSYIGPITQSITMYIPATGPNAWAPPGVPSTIAFELDMSPDTGSGAYNYDLENCIDFYITSAGTINIGYSFGGDALALASWPNSYLTQFASITTNDWYTITGTSYRAGNQTTDPAFSILSVYNSKGLLQGYLVRPQHANGLNQPGVGPGTALGQTDQVLILYMQAGTIPNGDLAISELGYYPGFPNDQQRPHITNAELAAGATHGVAYSGFTVATAVPNATAYSAIFPSGLSTLSINTSTGAVTGTPATAGTFYFVVAAANPRGVDAILVELVVL